MKIPKKIEPIISGISASIVIGVLAFITLRTSAGILLMFSFGATVFLVFALHELETAQPKNVFFGHLVSVLVGIIFNETIGFSFYSLGLAVGVAVTLMIYLKIMHPPAASNPLVVLFTDVSFEYILFPVIFGTLAIIVMSIFLNRIVLKRKYPKNKNWLY
jgi:CBS-domain-containing membrane protein|tara:strand:+ start:653 stop:1132 length:480 start_codon:yes stop_codon:yes gene_type:complete